MATGHNITMSNTDDDDMSNNDIIIRFSSDDKVFPAFLPTAKIGIKNMS